MPAGESSTAGQAEGDSPPHPAAVVGYLTAMLINPNDHALDGGPGTAATEREAVGQLATMFGFDAHLGHLTTSGTVANLEALLVARELHPDRGIAYGTRPITPTAGCVASSAWTAVPSPSTASGARMSEPWRNCCARAGSARWCSPRERPAWAAVDPVHEALVLRERYGVRVHVDAAHGGFFTLPAGADGPEGLPAAPWRAVAQADSIVVDPHEHGLQPYGCGAVLFRDPAVGRSYLHDSPYTCFTSDELHLGEISLECSRAGAARRRPVRRPAPEGHQGRRRSARSAQCADEAGIGDLCGAPASAPGGTRPLMRGC